MPYPMEYRHATEDFDRFLGDVIRETGLTTRNQAYTTVEAVLLCFRRRLSVYDAICFAQVLPAVLRAIFVAEWDIRETPETSWDLGQMTQEIKQLRVNHNFSGDTSIADVARALRQNVDAREFEACLGRLSPDARRFWS